MGNRGVILLMALLLSACGTTPSPTTPMPARTAEVTASALRAVADTFFAAYLECMSDPPEEASGRVSSYCQEHNPLATAALPEHLTAGGVAEAGADPITCGQNPPMGFAVDTATVASTASGTVIVRVDYLPAPLEITLQVVWEQAGLRVDDVRCPAA